MVDFYNTFNREVRKIIDILLIVIYFVILSTIIFKSILHAERLYEYVDSVFPLSYEKIKELIFYTWINSGSFPNLERTMRIGWLYPGVFIAELARIPIQVFIGIYINIVPILSGVGMYILLKYLYNKFFSKNKDNNIFYVVTIITSTIYAFSVVMFNRLWQYFFMPFYALLPLIFLFYLKFLETLRLRYGVLVAILAFLATTSPHNAIFIITLLSLFTFISLCTNRNVTLLKCFVFVLLLYILLTAPWTILMILTITYNITPPYAGTTAFTSRALEVYSEYSSLINSMRLLSGWGIPIRDSYPTDVVWSVISFILPVTIFLAVLICFYRQDAKDYYIIQKKFMLPILLILIITLFLSKGVLHPFGELYKRLVFYFSLGWLFRDPSRWLFILNFIYCLLIFYFLYRISILKSKIKYFLLGVWLFVYIYFIAPIITFYISNVYYSVRLPNSYLELLKIFHGKNEYNLLYLPLYEPSGYKYIWDLKKRYGPFIVWSLPDNINNIKFAFHKEKLEYPLYFLIHSDRLKKKVYLPKEILLSRYLTLLGIKYVILDTYVYNDKLNYTDVILRLNNSLLLKNVFDKKIYIFTNNQNVAKIYIARLPCITVESFNELLLLLYYLNNTYCVLFNQDIKHIKDLSLSIINISKLYNTVYLDSFENDTVLWDIQSKSNNCMIKKVKIGKNNRVFAIYNYNKNRICWVSSVPISINNSNRIILFEASILYNNAKRSHIAIYGTTDFKRWKQLYYCPLKRETPSHWIKCQTMMIIPSSIKAIKVSLAGGWSYDNIDPGITFFDNIRIYDINTFTLLSNGLSNNKHNISYFKERSFYFEKINPTLWEVYVNASKPFLLVFAEAYDPLWEAKIYKDGRLVERVRSIPVYGVINGFWVNQTGNLTIAIRYIPQDWFELGLKISGTTFLALLIYLIIPEKCWKKIFEKLKSKISGW